MRVAAFKQLGADSHVPSPNRSADAMFDRVFDERLQEKCRDPELPELFADGNLNMQPVFKPCTFDIEIRRYYFEFLAERREFRAGPKHGSQETRQPHQCREGSFRRGLN